MKVFVYVSLIAAALATGCSTTYHPLAGYTGGYSDVKLSDGLYQVQLTGDDLSTQKMHSFLLRRCAEVALENGSRFFSVRDGRNELVRGFDTDRRHGGSVTVPAQSLIVTLHPGSGTSLDAVQVIHDTDRDAGGRLSPGARAALGALQNRS